MRSTLVHLAVWALPASASAYEDQLAAGLDIAFAEALGNDARAGAGVGPHAKIGLDDTWNLFAAGMYAYHPGADALHVATLGAGVEYVFDVFQWIPYGGIGPEVFFASSGAQSDVEAGVQASLGIDYLASRDHSIGVCIRGHAPLTALEEFPLYLTIALRGSLLWDL